MTNFTCHNYFEKIKLSCSIRQWSSKISKIEQNDVTNDVIDLKTDTVGTRIFSQNVPLVILSNFTLHKYFVKIKSSCSKRWLSGQISEILQNDVNKWGHTSKMGYGMKKFFFSKCWSGLAKQLHLSSIFHRNHFKVLKIANMC